MCTDIKYLPILFELRNFDIVFKSKLISPFMSYKKCKKKRRNVTMDEHSEEYPPAGSHRVPMTRIYGRRAGGSSPYVGKVWTTIKIVKAIRSSSCTDMNNIADEHMPANADNDEAQLAGQGAVSDARLFLHFIKQVNSSEKLSYDRLKIGSAVKMIGANQETPAVGQDVYSYEYHSKIKDMSVTAAQHSATAGAEAPESNTCVVPSAINVSVGHCAGVPLDFTNFSVEGKKKDSSSSRVRRGRVDVTEANRIISGTVYSYIERSNMMRLDGDVLSEMLCGGTQAKVEHAKRTGGDVLEITPENTSVISARRRIK